MNLIKNPKLYKEDFQIAKLLLFDEFIIYNSMYKYIKYKYQIKSN